MAAIASYEVGPAVTNGNSNVVLNCDHGDPTLFEEYWGVHKEAYVQVTYANALLSYFADTKGPEHGPWFVSVAFNDAVRELHALVGNAVTRGTLIVAAVGSTQLYQATLYALSRAKSGKSTAVVAEAPYYSSYPGILNYLQSDRFHWAGDSKAFQPEEGEEFIEYVTSPNNPCGALRKELVSGGNGVVVHDLAYYWPTFTPITKALDHDVMLFTLSKCTGHAGMRIGWAIVKDPAVATKMAKFIEINTIGVSQDAQVRAAGLMRAVMKGYADGPHEPSTVPSNWKLEDLLANKQFFHYGKAVMESRWNAVRATLAGHKNFSVPDPAEPATCAFLKTAYTTYSAFVWLKCETEEDCQELLKTKGNILSRGGAAFGVSAQYARLSLVDRQPAVDLLLERLAAL